MKRPDKKKKKQTKTVSIQDRKDSIHAMLFNYNIKIMAVTFSPQILNKNSTFKVPLHISNN